MSIRGVSLLGRLALLVIVAAPAGCGSKNQLQPPPPLKVSVAVPVQQTVTEYLEETGTTEAVDKVEIRARVTGFLEQIEFDAGADVQEGDVLYIIEQRPFKAAVAAAAADVQARRVARDKAKVEFDRQESLYAENATAERKVVAAKAEWEGAVAAVAEAEAALDVARLQLEYTEVRAPISGRVGKTLVKRGNLVDGTQATHLTTVIKYDPIYANFNISERDYLTLREARGDRVDTDDQPPADVTDVKVELRRAVDSGFPYAGHFNYAALDVDQSTGTYMIRGIFANPNLDIVPGLFVRVRLPIGVHEAALLVPEAAIGADQLGRFVLVVNSKNIVERRKVVLGTRQAGMQVVLEGLTQDDRVITAGVQRARPGSEVAPQEVDISRTDATTDETPPELSKVSEDVADEPAHGEETADES